MPADLLLVGRRPISAPRPAHVLISDVTTRGCWDVIAARADIVFFVAGNSSVHAAAARPAESEVVALLPLRHLTEAARTSGRPFRVVHASSSRVYGTSTDAPAREEDAAPVTPFGRHCLLAEEFLATESRGSGLEPVSLRVGNVYGPSPGDAPQGKVVLNRIARLAVQGADIPLYGDGNYLRDHVYIDDVVRAFLAAGAHPGVAGAFNVASGASVTMRDAFELVAERAARLTGRRSRICEVAWPSGESPIEIRSFRADVRKFSGTTGWMPRVSLSEGIDRLVQVCGFDPTP